MAVKVQFQIGHSSKLRSKKTVEGFTHDWELYVKGVQQADISAFVEKIIFNLHESFQKPKRVCNKPPYVIQESGYAGFIVFIDIYFRNRDEPKKVQFNYDLDLQTTGPPQHRHDVKTFIFDNPSEEFRQKLLKGGGVPVSGVVAGSQPPMNNNIVAMTNVPNLSHTPGDVHKPLLTEGKKHKSRPDDARSNSFANLFGPPITKTSAAAVVATAVTKHSPDNKSAITAAHVAHQSSAGTGLPTVKEKSSKDKDKSSEKSKERSEKREKHHKQSLTSPHKEGRSESKKSDGSKHDKRDKTEEKSKKDKNRDKDRERERDKSSSANVNNSISNNKRPPSPKLAREHSPHKSVPPGVIPPNAAVNNANSIQRPSSSSSGKIGEEVKTSIKSSKDSTGESKSKESKQKESSSSSSGKKSKKEKKDKDKERDKEKRHEEREKQKLSEQTQQRSSGTKEDGGKITNNINAHTNNTISVDIKNSKAAATTTTNPINTNIPNDVVRKPEKLAKQDLFKTSNDKTATINTSTTLAPSAPVQANNSVTHNSTDKKSSSNTSLNSNSNPAEKDKRSHKHKKKEKSKDKDKDRERDKERDKDKDKDKERDKDKEKNKDKEKEHETKKEKEAKDKHAEDKTADNILSNQQSTIATKALSTQPVNAAEEQSNSLKSLAPSSTITSNVALFTETAPIPSSSSSSLTSSAKSSKNKEKKSKEKSSSKEEKLKHKINDTDTSESKAKQPKLSSNNSTHISSSVSTSSSSSSSIPTSITNAANNPPNLTQPAGTAVANSRAETNLNLDLSDADSLPTAPIEQVASSLPNSNNNNNNSSAKASVQPSPIITHSDSSNSSFPDLPLPKQPLATKPQVSRERPKSITATAPVATAAAPLINPVSKESPKVNKSTAKEKSLDKPSKEEEREKKKRRNSQAVNTFIEPPLKQMKTKEPSKSIREKSKSPSLRNVGSRASISSEASTTFLQPSASPSSTAAAAPLPPPSSAPSAAHSPALSATEAVGNATSATANAATCNSNSTSSSLTSNTGMVGPHQLPLDYLSELQELHHKIMTLQDNEDLQHVVELIAATGCYEITTKTFDFDLCKLDRGTVQRLQEFFATSVS